MASATKVRPPFAWLSRFWVPATLSSIVAIAGFLRFYQLATLPPGLDETSARIGLQALRLGASHWLPALDSANGYAPLWIWLQALSIQIFGHTTLALKMWPALLGALAVLATWFWIRDWFGKRPAWIAAFLMAVSPWALSISRNGLESALPPLLVPLTLWTFMLALRKPATWQCVALAIVLSLDLLSGPIGWILAICTIAFGIWKLTKNRSLLALSKQKAVGAAVLAGGIGLFGYLAGNSLTSITAMPQALNLPHSLGALGHNLVKVLLMFNIRGDENYRHNLVGEPLLNAFVGIMMVAGLLISISRLHQRHYRIFLILLCTLLLPAILASTGVPNSSWATGALPLVFALAGIGTSYMLELWYATFPINSAAKATGQAAIILLLALTALQGYTQYFRAWAGSTAVYLAYNEGTTQIAKHLTTDKFAGERYVVTPADQIPVVEYLNYRQSRYHPVDASKLEGLPIASASRKFYITAASHDEALKVLKAKFPGGTLLPHYSDFNLVEIYYTYEVNK